MKADLLSFLLESQSPADVLDYLDQTSFDDMAQIDLHADRCVNRVHTDEKYLMPVLDGSFSALYHYAGEHMVHPDDRGIQRAFLDPETLEARLESAHPQGVLQAEFRLRLTDGGWCWTRQLILGGPRFGLPKGVVRSYIYDIQDQKTAGDALHSGRRRGVRRDELTGLLLEKDFFALAEEKRRTVTGKWCLIAIDIEHYKLFMDWHGREKGLYVLTQFGDILNRAAEESGGLAGYRGQDDFCLMAPYDREKIEDLFRSLREVIVSLSETVGFFPLFGISLIDDDKEPILEVFNHAALMAEEAKGNVHSRIQVYDGTLKEKNAEEYRLLLDFQKALENGEVVFWLQPQCRVSTRKIVGAESLARWRRPDGTWVPPALFVPILERHGIVTNLDKFIWESVCKWLRKLMDQGYNPVPISMNVSPIDLFTIDVPAYLAGLLIKYDLPAELLKIEITESAYVDDTSTVRSTVKRLREMGFLVLMDDFGSGYSSLNMLRSLNVDVIKLDAQFLHLTRRDERKGIGILESVINMAKTLSTPVIVEGVENQEQVVFLSDLGCRYMQGYFFHRPMPPEAFETLIADETNTDHHGFEFKANQEMHVREFLDENVFSDAMLNNILGPVAFYYWTDEGVDIVRYNQQFYLMAGQSLESLNDRLRNIQQYFYQDDRDRFIQTLDRAAADRLNGAEGIFRVYKPNGVICWIQVHVYYVGSDDRGKRFYAACQDVTELQYLNSDIPGSYFRCGKDAGYEFYYISQNFLAMLGYTAEEIREQFDNRLINLVHPMDRDALIRGSQALAEKKSSVLRPYRLRKKNGQYIYVAEQCQLTDRYGPPCWQSVAVDVTEVMTLRNQMRLLARFSSDSVVFVRKTEQGLRLEVTVHGLEERMGLDKERFERSLNDGSFYTWLEGEREIRYQELQDYFSRHANAYECEFMVHPPNGHHIRLHMKVDRVTDSSVTTVAYIAVLREI